MQYLAIALILLVAFMVVVRNRTKPPPEKRFKPRWAEEKDRPRFRRRR